MSLIVLFVYIGLIWLAVWAIKSIVPMEPPGQKALTVVAVIVTVLIVLWAFGILPETGPVVPRLR